MKLEVNLLQETQKIQSKIRRLGAMLQTVSIVVLVGFSVIVFGLLSYSLILKGQLEKVEQEVSDQGRIIESLRPIESMHVLVKQKASIINSLLQEPSVEFLFANQLFTFSREMVTIRGVQVLEGVGAISMSGVAPDVFGLVDYLASLSEYVEDKEVARIRATSFTRGPSGGYQFGIIFDLVEE